MKIIFEDNHILVLEKPKGLLTQPSPIEQESLETQGKAYLKSTYNKPGNVFLEAIHRLDRPVSGLVVFAKTSKALSRLQQAIRDKNCKKIYHAHVEKAPPQPTGTLEHTLLHDEHKAVLSNQGKLCRLHYKTLHSPKHLEIELETGRYHQIRAQLSCIGCPIIGDTKYGSKTPLNSLGIALHHTQMTIVHPITKEWLSFTSEEQSL